jgi:dihydrofolate reductase
MRKVIVNEFISLDEVAQAPGGADEDTSGGFEHGGWHMRYMEDELAQKRVLASIVEAGGFLLGRRTFEIFAAYWPNAPEEEQVIAEPLNSKPKYVVSKGTGRSCRPASKWAAGPFWPFEPRTTRVPRTLG